SGGKVPVVLLGERSVGASIDHIAIDNVDAARTATAHLIGLGRRRIAAIGARSGKDSRMADLRLAGYRDARASAGLPGDEEIVVTTEWFTRRDGHAAVLDLFGSGARP